MRTVNDFLKAKASLSVTCRNCDHTACVTPLFLKARLGLYSEVVKGKFVCSLCKSPNVKLSIATAEAADKKLSPKMNFGGVYEKYED